LARIEMFALTKNAHVLLVLLSGGLFAFRGAAVLAGAGEHVMAPRWRYASYLIDTALLLAGVVLAVQLALSPLEHWFGVKLVLLVVYIVLGSFALKRGRTPAIRAACYLLAITAYCWMIGVALRHDPLSWLA
jgi:uncharacterized membrane protein SirB2